MEGLLAAWLVGEGIVGWRWFKQGAPPPPGSLLAVSGFFALLAVLAIHPPARGVATALAVGIDIAALAGEAEALRGEGATVIFMSIDGKLGGLIAIAATVAAEKATVPDTRIFQRLEYSIQSKTASRNKNTTWGFATTSKSDAPANQSRLRAARIKNSVIPSSTSTVS